MKMALSEPEQKRKLWTQCLFLSLGVHVLAGAYFYWSPLQLKSPIDSLFGLTVSASKPFPQPDDLDLITKNALIEEAFKTIVLMPKEGQLPHDFQELSQGIALSPTKEELEGSIDTETITSHFEPLIDQHTVTKEAIIQQLDELSPSPLFQALEAKARLAAIPDVDSTLASIELPFTIPESLHEYDEALSLPPLALSPMQDENDPIDSLIAYSSPLANKEPSEISFYTPLNPSLSQEESPTTLLVPRLPSPSPLSSRSVTLSSPLQEIPTYSLPTLSNKALWNDDFTTNLAFTKNPHGPGYLFSLALTPKQDLTQHQLQQSFHFLIDNTASSQKHRFAVFKKAVLKAIQSLSADDMFNIVILQSENSLLSKKPLPATLHNKRLAETFLSKQTSRAFLETSNVYKRLPSVLRHITQEQWAHTAILLSDGLGVSTEKKRKLCSQWIQSNRGKVNLYTAAVGKDNELFTLDLLSTQSGGRLLHSDTHASFPRKLTKLVLDLKHPIAKDVSIAIKPHSNAHVELYPAASTLPFLYGNEPYVIYGAIDHPSSFDLLLQARHNDEWIGVQKTLSFKNALPMESQSVKRCQKMQSSQFYEQFLKNGQLSSLQKAEALFNQSQQYKCNKS